MSPLSLGDTDPGPMALIEKATEIISAFRDKWEKRTDWLNEPAVLKEALTEYEKIFAGLGLVGPISFYLGLRQAQEEDSTELKAKENKIADRIRKNLELVRFFEHRLAETPEDVQKKFLTYSDLSLYHHYLERLFIEAKYLLSEAEEKIMTAKGAVSHGKWVDMVSTFLSEEEWPVAEKTRPFSELVSLTSDRDKKIRDEAALGVHSVMAKLAPVAEAEMNAILENKRINDDLRSFKEPDESRLVSDDMPTEAVSAMLSAVTENFGIAKDFYVLKAKLLGLPKLAYHERNVPYGVLTTEYPFPEAADLVYQTFNDLDPEFGAIFQEFAEKGRIDVFPKKGKSGGAFCATESLVTPTYILLNHTNKLHDVLTIAHEAGHGLNNEFMRKKRHALSFGTTLATAEVASTFMEDFVLERLACGVNEEERLAIYMMKLGDDVSTIFRQASFYLFERELHKEFREKGYLSRHEIGKIFQKHMVAYMGPAVEQSAGSENWWVYVSHFRRFFYVYSYASGLLISKAMQKEVKKDKKFIEKVKEFLSAGLSEAPMETFKKMGIDIMNPNFWQEGISETRALLAETEALAKKLGKM